MTLDGTTRMRRLRVPPCVAAMIGYADAMDQWSCYSRAGERASVCVYSTLAHLSRDAAARRG